MQIPIDHYASGEYLYDRMCAPLCQKHGLTHMEFVVLMFLANNPGFDTAAQIVKYRRLTKSHVSLAVRSLLERRFLIGKTAWTTGEPFTSVLQTMQKKLLQKAEKRRNGSLKLFSKVFLSRSGI